MNYDYEMLRSKILKYKNMEMNEVDKDSLKEIDEINISRKKCSKERILDFLSDIDNPYFFKVNGKIVQIAYSNSNSTAEECLTNVLKNLYK